MLTLNADDDVVSLDDAPQHVVYIGADALLELKARQTASAMRASFDKPMTQPLGI